MLCAYFHVHAVFSFLPDGFCHSAACAGNLFRAPTVCLGSFHLDEDAVGRAVLYALLILSAPGYQQDNRYMEYHISYHSFHLVLE